MKLPTSPKEFRIWSYYYERWITDEDRIFVTLLGEVVCSQDYYDGAIDKLDNIEVVQYTGLKDREGKKIFEGDVVEVSEKDGEYLIIYYGAMCSFLLKKIGKFSTHFSIRECREFEIIGNIFENSELLEGE